MRISIYFSLFFILFLSSSNICKSQFYSQSELDQEYDKIIKSKIYFVIDQNTHEKNIEYAEILKKYWAFSGVEIINSSELFQNLKIGNYYFTLNYNYSWDFTIDKPASTRWFFYSLWTPDSLILEKYMKNVKLNKNIESSNFKIELASARLIVDKSVSFKISNIYAGEYFGNGYALYGGLGMFKNYIQAFQMFLVNHKKYITFNNKKNSILECNEKEINKLKQTILYIPNTSLSHTSANNFTVYLEYKDTPCKVGDLLKKYPGKYEVIDIKELNEKIIANDKPIYYFINIDYNEIGIINSETGEFIFKQVINRPSGLRSSDLDKVVEIMNK